MQAVTALPESDIQAALEAEVLALKNEVVELKDRLAWFHRHVFGEKSEKRHILMPHQDQSDLLASLGLKPETPEAPAMEKIAYERRKRGPKNRDGSVTDDGIRFGEDVPVETIVLMPPEAEAIPEERRVIVGQKVTRRLAQLPGSYVILEYVRPVIKDSADQAEDGKKAKLYTAPAPANVLDRSIGDVSLLAAMLVDKFVYHLPLHRQHQRMGDAGITLARSTLSVLVSRAIDQLEPICEAQYRRILKSAVLGMDETPIKAGRKARGKMRQGQLWPLYGDRDEVVFKYTDTRKAKHVRELLGEYFSGVLLTDGYEGYASYAKVMEKITHAVCWSHARRKFEGALNAEPKAADEALALIGLLYAHEKEIRKEELSGKEKLDYRIEHSLPVVKAFWDWCDRQCRRHDLLPSNPLTKALKYAMERKVPLQVFLSDPDVPLDTNHVERAVRPIAMGRKNWLFCWTEVGAKRVAVIQSLLVTCRLHGIDPYVYLVDVLQRVGQHPDKHVADLTPRIWKEKFGDDPLKSDLDRIRAGPG